MSWTARVAAVLTLAALTLAGCGQDDSSESGGGATESPSASPSDPADPTLGQSRADFKACLVSHPGGINDTWFNRSSHDGLLNAAKSLGIETRQVESGAEPEFGDSIETMVQVGCDSITTVGFRFGEATEKAARKNPDVDFSSVDNIYGRPAKNLKAMQFDTSQPSFLAGYLAAGVSQSGVVGTFGGANIPTVTLFMDGFVAGVERYNDDNDADVQVLGWDRETRTGTFINSVQSKALGRGAAEDEIARGADIIFPVAGAAGLGALQAVKDRHLKAIWAETDGCRSVPEYCDVLLTSVIKEMDVAVEQAIKSSVDGAFDNRPYTGTLANGGVALAPFHDQQSAVPAELVSKIDDLKQQIASGDIKVQE